MVGGGTMALVSSRVCTLCFLWGAFSMFLTHETNLVSSESGVPPSSCYLRELTIIPCSRAKKLLEARVLGSAQTKGRDIRDSFGSGVAQGCIWEARSALPWVQPLQ